MALEGPWKIVRIEKGKHADAFWARICKYPSTLDPATTTRLNFHLVNSGCPHFEIRRLGPPPIGVRIDSRISGNIAMEAPVWFAPLLGCRIDPTAAQKTIDVFANVDPPFETPAALGIYEIEGRHLKIRLTKYLAAIKNNQRPNSFAVPPDSGDILFIFERYRPSEDEKKSEGKWAILSQTIDGNSVSKEQLPSTGYSFRDNLFSTTENTMMVQNGPHVSMGRGKITRNGTYVLDAAKQPKQITTHSFGRGTPAREDLFGIYKFERDRLTIAWRKDGPPPDKFESQPGSGVTLIELQKADGHGATSNAKDETEAEMVPGNVSEKTAEIAAQRIATLEELVRAVQSNYLN